MTKDVRELRALRGVYDEREFSLVRRGMPGAEPDFVLQHGRGPLFGVEVTEVHESESDARLERIPGYFNELIAGRPPRHRDDVHGLPVGDAEILRPMPDGSYTPAGRTRMIFRPMPGPDVMVRRLLERLATKHGKAERYNGNLDHVNLILDDQIHVFAYAPAEDLPAALFTPEVKRSLLGSSFSEVYLITALRPWCPESAESSATDSQPNPEWRVVPLRMLLLWREAYLYSHAAVEFRTSVRPGLGVDELPLFPEALAQLGAAVHVAPAPAGRQVILGDCGLALDAAGETALYRRADYGLPAGAQQYEPSAALTPVQEEFMRYFTDFSDRHVFRTPLSFPILAERST